jgi:hypothetical protein
MRTITTSLSLVDDTGRLLTKPFLLDVVADVQVTDYIEMLSRAVLRRPSFYIPGYSAGLTGGGYTADSGTRHYTGGPDFNYVPAMNHIGSVTESMQTAVRLWFHDKMENSVYANQFELYLRDLPAVAGQVQMEYIHDWSYRHEFIPFISWTHSDQYKPTCFSCMMGVRELMNAVEFCKGKIATDQAKDNEWGGITIFDDKDCLSVHCDKSHIIRLDKTDDILKEFAKWFTSSFQGTLEMAHIDDISFITPDRTVTLHLGY